MKKSYKSIKAFLVLLSMVALKLGAQPLAGVVTINGTLPSSATNFTSFTQFATSLNTNGISGPLTVNVANAIYNEQVTFTQITGASATNTITINGNGSTLTFNGSSTAAQTMWLNGTDYLNVNNMTMLGTNTTYAMVLIFSSQANNNTFTSCTFSTTNNGTGSYQCPISWSGSNQFLSGGTDAGNNNTIQTSTVVGGYYAIYHYGLTSGSYTHDNSILNCYITDYYYMCLYVYYSKNLTVKNCKFDRLTRTTLTSGYFCYGYYAQGFDFENNIVERMFDGSPTSTSTWYGFYSLGYYNPSGAQDINPCKIINNVFRNMSGNGTYYVMMYVYYSDIRIQHNTFSFDNTSATGGSTYVFYYYYGGNNMYGVIKNNNITITRGGTGSKYAFYLGNSTLSGTVQDNNNVYVNSAGGNNYYGYTTSNQAALSNWQTSGLGATEANGTSVDPQYISLATNDLHPTNTAMNNKGAALGIPYDNLYATRSQLTPDMGAYEFLNPNCTTTPGTNSVVSNAYTICPGDNVLLNVGSYSGDVGLTYQWMTSSLSAIGPWTAVPNATTVVYQSPAIASTLYYGVAITCTNAVGSTTAAALINVAGTTTNSVPYYESFEGVIRANRLPNCSWLVPGIGNSAFTYTSSNTYGRNPRTGSKFASFAASSGASADNYFYTSGIQLNAGITYSASVWWQTEYFGYSNFTNLAIVLGTSQSTTGLTTIATTGGPAVSNVYKELANTFQVATSGIYYVGIKATSISGSAPYLTWDDLSITIPCTANAPTLSLVSNSTTICNGDQVVITASGADTYTWSTGSNLNTLTDSPYQNIIYTVMGSNAASGCVTTMTQAINVNPIPSVFAYASNASVCQGQTTNLTAIGNAVSYSWSNSMTGAMITVTPAASTSYSVVGTNAYGCVATAVQPITVLNNPNIGVSSSQPNDMCVGETQMLTATGGVSYQWASSTGGLYQGAVINISPMVTTVYTVTGTGANGCSSKNTINQSVAECTGLKENPLNAVRIYPNPTSGLITLALNDKSEKSISVIDVTGRVVSTNSGALDVVKIDLSNLANGVYYVKVQSTSATQVVKVVKN